MGVVSILKYANVELSAPAEWIGSMPFNLLYCDVYSSMLLSHLALTLG